MEMRMAHERINSPRINAYLALERAMVDLDDAGDFAVADELRDRMDPVWWLLSEPERAALDARQGSATFFAGRVSLEPQLGAALNAEATAVLATPLESRIRASANSAVILSRGLAVRAQVRAHFQLEYRA
jgi:hypothetical protein